MSLAGKYQSKSVVNSTYIWALDGVMLYRIIFWILPDKKLKGSYRTVRYRDRKNAKSTAVVISAV